MDEVNSGSCKVEADDRLAAASAASVPWSPKGFVFRAYEPGFGSEAAAKAQNLRVVVKRPLSGCGMENVCGSFGDDGVADEIMFLVSRLTKDIVDTYRICNPQFNYSDELNPKRFLTSPSAGVLNDGHDNENSDLILTVNCGLVNLDTRRRYVVKDILGQGTFGQVAKCWVSELNCFVAVKIIKNQQAYYHQALVEVSILTTLNKKFDPEDKHHIVRIYDYFVHQQHLCIVFELLDTNLYELIKLNHFRGLSLSIVQLFSKQILYGLALMKDAAIIHCDLKPENILLCTSVKPAEIKIIDFGSACMEDHTVYSYIQSRYYRSPEVLLGYQYPWMQICSFYFLACAIIFQLQEQPPDYVLKEAKNTNKFFKCVGSVNHEESGYVSSSGRRELKKPPIGKEYFNHMNLEAIVKKYPYRKNLQDEDLARESQIRLALIDFLRGLVEFDPAKRWSPLQASKHPFVTGEPFTCPYTPAPETPRVPVSHNLKVDHHPAAGHWFAAGLSPNVLGGGNRVTMYNNSHFQVMPYAHGGNYGSLGSHGSYNDGIGLGSSYGSYGDNSNVLTFFSPVGPSGMNNYAQGNGPTLGSSPDARRRIMQIPHGNGYGFSPAGNFAPMSLGTSPSQFTPPYSQVSNVSPGHYGPSSPARGNCHGSPLGKGTGSVNQMNRRKGWGYSGNLPPSQESTSAGGNWQGFSEQQQRSGGNASGHISFGSGIPIPHAKGAVHDKAESSSSLPDPGDWDPNYSDELLLQDDPSELSSLATEFSKSMHVNQAFAPTESFVGVARFNQMSSTNMSMQRPNGPAFSHAEAGSPVSSPDVYVHPMMTPSHLMPHFSQFSPSRLGQQPVQRFNHGRSMGIRGGEWNHVKVQAPLSNFNSGGPRSPGSNSAPWGRRGNHPIAANILPSSHGGNEYGRIS
ncbi:hypothetical protein OSB04_025830 [Centaurea solstitialis]|uniref:Protein kinase domain-containing protein n=1 Tax=Centaurea solstitialis TaxID=347529 RepID=A0AA38SWC4_9ASTR|nr:hypothetical protein OSB04_025830 [Centaurea solstitialis]